VLTVDSDGCAMDLVQHAGKNLQFYLPIEEVEEALSKLSARGLIIHTSARSETEARELLKNVEKWSVDRV